jgi:hypothetical protein
LLVVGQVSDVVDQEDLPSTGQVGGLADPDLLFVGVRILSKILDELLVFVRQAVGLWYKVVDRSENYLFV